MQIKVALIIISLLIAVTSMGAVAADRGIDPALTDPPLPEDPVVESPVVESPVVESPVVESPVVESPVVESPVVESPVVEGPVVENHILKTQLFPETINFHVKNKFITKQSGFSNLDSLKESIYNTDNSKEVNSREKISKNSVSASSKLLLQYFLKTLSTTTPTNPTKESKLPAITLASGILLLISGVLLSKN
jgi:hypothetical protein